MLTASDMEWLLSTALWLAAAAHFLILAASFQVPTRLNWKNDLVKLTPFNRKLIWKGGAFIVLTIISFGILTLYLHDEMLHGGRVALGIALFIGIFWIARVLTDLFYFSHKDWPSGINMFVGHCLLMALFLMLSMTYLGLVLWRMLL